MAKKKKFPLDAQIAGIVMGFNLFNGLIVEEWPDVKGVYTPRKPKPYSTDILAAWEVVEKMQSEGWRLDISGSRYFGPNMGGYEVQIVCASGVRGHYSAYEETAPMAICMAALKAVKDQEE